MSSKTIADLVVEAANTGEEAKFLAASVTYDFSPEGLAAYVAAAGVIPASLQTILNDFETRISALEP